MPETRSPELVRREIAREREELADAVDRLRAQVAIDRVVGSRVAVLAPAAFAAGFVVSGGIGATMRYFARRGRER